MRNAFRTLGPLLVAPRTAGFAVLLVGPVVVVHVLDGPVGHLDTLREMASSPDGLPWARRSAMRWAGMLGSILGALVGAAVFEGQRMHASWGLPAFRTDLRRGLVAMGALAAGLGAAWVAMWLPPSDAVLFGLMGAVLFSVLAAWGYLPLLIRSPRAAALLPVGLIGVLLFAPDWLVGIALALGVPGVVLLAVASHGLLWWGTSPTGHRRAMAWTLTHGPVTTPAAGDVADSPPDGTMAWLRRLADETPASPVVHRALPWPHAAGLTMATALMFVLSYLTGSNGSLIGLVAAQQGDMAAGRPLPYPLSRQARARLQFAHQGVALAIMAAVTAVLATAFAAFDVPTIAWFMDDRAATCPPVVTVAAMLAMLPIGQAGHAWSPVGAWPTLRFRAQLMQFLPVLPFVIAASLLADQVWERSAQQPLAAVAWCVLAGLLLQAGNYTYLQAVFRRRDLAMRGTP